MFHLLVVYLQAIEAYGALSEWIQSSLIPQVRGKPIYNEMRKVMNNTEHELSDLEIRLKVNIAISISFYLTIDKCFRSFITRLE